MWVDFAIYLAACFVAGSTGGLFPPGDWYENLKKTALDTAKLDVSCRLDDALRFDGLCWGTAVADRRSWNSACALVIADRIECALDASILRIEENQIGALLHFRPLGGSRSVCHCVLAIFLDRWAGVCAISVVG